MRRIATSESTLGEKSPLYHKYEKLGENGRNQRLARSWYKRSVFTLILP